MVLASRNDHIVSEIGITHNGASIAINSMIKSLRRLVDLLRFSELKKIPQHYFTKTNDVQVLPLLALAYTHLNERSDLV